MHKISYNEFKFNSDSPQSSDCSTLASNLQKYPLKYMVPGDSVIYTKNDKVVRKIIEQIKISNMFNLLSSPEFQNPKSKLYTLYDHVDEFYGTKYTTFSYGADKIQKFIPIRGIDVDIINENNGDAFNTREFSVSQENKYLPSNLDMVCRKEWRFRTKIDLDDCSKEAFLSDAKDIDVKLVAADEKGEMWFKQMRSYLIPIVNINIRIETDKNTLLESTKLYFFETLLAEFTIQNFYSIEAGYSFTFSETLNGIQFSISGYSDKIMEVTEELLRSIKHLQITQESFDLNKDKFIAELNADKYQKPYLIAFTFTKELYKEHGRTFDRILETGLNITLEDMQTFHSSLFDHVYVKALVFGNMMPNDAVQVKQKIDSILDFGVLRNPSLLDPNIKQIDVLHKASEKVTERIHILNGPYAYVYHLYNKDEEDSAIVNSYQVAYLKKDDIESLKNLLFLEVTSSLLSNYAYEVLRTEKLLGYIVSCSAFEIGRAAFLYVVIQGNKESPEVMDYEIEIMLREFRYYELSTLSEKSFENLKQSILNTIIIKDESFNERTARIWKEIVERDHDFTVREKLALELQKATLSEFLNFYDTKVIPKDPSNMKKLSVQFYSYINYPVLPKSLNNTFTPYKGMNSLNSDLIESKR